MQEKKLILSNKLGLHARASMKLTDLAMAFGSHIQIGYQGRLVNAKSIMEVMVLGATYEQEVLIRAEGDDAQAAVEAIADLIMNRFGESE
jgi:phosphocarrier protein HPr